VAIVRVGWLVVAMEIGSALGDGRGVRRSTHRH